MGEKLHKTEYYLLNELKGIKIIPKLCFVHCCQTSQLFTSLLFVSFSMG